jgi:hypothetical protein
MPREAEASATWVFGTAPSPVEPGHLGGIAGDPASSLKPEPPEPIGNVGESPIRRKVKAI